MGQRAKSEGEKLMRKIFFCLTLSTILFPLCSSGEAQPKIPGIGYLSIGSPAFTPARVEAFR
jgi:hypothetical protein